MKSMHLLSFIGCMSFITHIYAMDINQLPYDPELDATQNSQNTEYLEPEPPFVLQKAYFTPNILDVIVKLINEEQESIHLACYRLTQYTTAYSLAARSYDLPVDIIVDNSFQRDHCDGLAVLVDSKAVVRCNIARYQGKYENMHHKFCIFNKTVDDKKILITGSFNWTGQASCNNWENIVIIEDEETINEFEHEFQSSLEYTRPITAAECQCTVRKSSFSKELNAIP